MSSSFPRSSRRLGVRMFISKCQRLFVRERKLKKKYLPSINSAPNDCHVHRCRNVLRLHASRKTQYFEFRALYPLIQAGD
jgi:hypothetical protein